MRLLLVVPARTLEQMGRCQLTFSLAQNWVSMGEDFSMGEGERERERGVVIMVHGNSHNYV